MPSWTRIAVPSSEIRLPAAATVRRLFTDPSLWTEFAYARSASFFMAIESIDAGCKVELYRWSGARADALARIDATPLDTLTAAGVARWSWPTPLPAAGRLEVVVGRTSAGDKVVTLGVLQAMTSEAS